MNWHSPRNAIRAARRPRRRRRLRPARLHGLTINKLIPNMLTVGALCAGMTAIRFAVQDQWQTAVLCIVLAMILDGLDGTMARLLKGATPLGAELDSLADFISFGVAPAIVIYYWSTAELGGSGWAIALIYAMCCGFRLARFNVVGLTGQELPPYAYKYFTGVPAPAGAGVALLPMLIAFATEDWQSWAITLPPSAVGIWMLMAGLMMASSIPTYSIKNVKIPHEYVPLALVAVGAFGAAVISAPWSTMSVFGIVYMCSIPLSRRTFARLKREADKLKAAEEDGAADGEPAPAVSATDLDPAERSDAKGPG